LASEDILHEPISVDGMVERLADPLVPEHFLR
jgi:hypothetical protein